MRTTSDVGRSKEGVIGIRQSGMYDWWLMEEKGRRYVGRGRAQLRRLSVRVGGGIMGWMLVYVEGEGWNRRRVR